MDNPYLLAIYGWVFFNALLLGLAKDHEDNKKKPFDFNIWWKYHWDNIVITGLAIPIIVEFTDDLWYFIINIFFKREYEYSRLSLLGSVPFVQFLYFLIRKIFR